MSLASDIHYQQIGFLDTYQLAQQNNAQHQGKIALSQSEAIFEKTALSALLPQINADISQSSIHQNIENAQTLDLSQDNLTECLADLTNLDCFFSPTDNSFSSTSYSISVSQALFRLPRWFDYLKGKQIAKQADLKIRQAQVNLMLESALLYLNSLRSYSALQTARQDSQRRQSLLSQTQDKFEQGLVKRIVVLSAQSQYQFTQTQTQTALLEYENALNALQNLIHLNTISHVEIATLDIQFPPPATDNSTDWLNKAKTHNPDWQLAQLNTAISRLNYLSKRSQHAPTLDIFARHSETNSDGRTPTIDEGTLVQKTVGLNFNLPIYTGGRLTSQTQQSRWQYKQSLHQAQQVQQELTQQIQQQLRLINHYVASEQQLNHAVEDQKIVFETMREAYSSGVYKLIEILDAEEQLMALSQDQMNLQVDYLIATLRLKRLTGTLNERDLSILDQWLMRQI